MTFCPPWGLNEFHRSELNEFAKKELVTPDRFRVIGPKLSLTQTRGGSGETCL